MEGGGDDLDIVGVLPTKQEAYGAAYHGQGWLRDY